MAFFDKLNDFAKNVSDKAGDAIEITKLNSKINSEQSAIAAVMKQIGEFCYNKYAETGTADEGIAEFCAAIDGHNATIAGAKSEIERIKSENAAEAAASDTASTAADGTICTACGKENAACTKFCAECGAKFK